MTYSPGSGRNRIAKLLLLVGFLALAGAVVAARRDPATAYELSIYAATPTAFWVGVYAALFVGLVVALLPDAGRLRGGAILLGGAAAISIVALPVLRGYHFYGTADPLTHLGWARDLSTGALDTFTFFYPGLHGITVVLNRLGGYSLERGVLVGVLLFAVVYVIFVALTVRTVSGGAGALAIGAFSAFPFLPINNLSVSFKAHPFSQTTLFAALALFLFVKYVTEADDATGRGWLARFGGGSPYGLLLVVAGGGAVLYHPQAATDLLVIFAAVCAVQFLVRWRRPGHPIAGHRTMYAPTALVALVYAGWTLRTDWFFGSAERHAAQLMEFVLGGGAAGEAVASQGSSLAAIGVGLPEIFLKLFGVNAAYGVLAALLVLLVALGRIDRDGADTAALTTYLAAAGAGIAALIALYFVGSISEMYFRHLGFLSLLVTVLGAVALLELTSAVSARATPGRLRVAIAIWFVLALPLGLATVYQSPYIYKASQHVPEAQMDGYAFAFEQAGADEPVAGVRVRPARFSDAIYGTVESDANQEAGRWNYVRGVPDGGLARLGESVGEGYVIVTDADRQREVGPYQELRHSRSGFRSLDAQAGVDRVHSTGEADLYLVE